MTSVPDTQPTESIAEKFACLAAIWREAAPRRPRQPIHYDHPAYQEIVAMGPGVIPHLLRDLAQNHRDWFWALHLITGADPVLPGERDDPFQMTKAWLRWGREHGHLLPEENAANKDTEAGQSPTGQQRGTLPERRGESGTSVAQRFEQLASIWRAETAIQSSFTAITYHPAFQEIVSMGEAVVPLLLNELDEGPSLLVWALPEIMGTNPAPTSDAGKIAKLGEAWLRWGKEKGYQW